MPVYVGSRYSVIYYHMLSYHSYGSLWCLCHDCIVQRTIQFDFILTLSQFHIFCVMWLSGEVERTSKKARSCTSVGTPTPLVRLCQERSLSTKPVRCSGKCPTAERLSRLGRTTTMAVASPPTPGPLGIFFATGLWLGGQRLLPSIAQTHHCGATSTCCSSIHLR
jgi:hypothetical protein